MRIAGVLTALITLVWVGHSAGAASTQPAKPANPAASIRWYQQSIVEAYEKVGERSPSWDAAARALLAAWARRLAADEDTPTGDEEDQILVASKLTRAANCTDPLVLYATARNMEYWHRKPSEIAEFASRAASGMKASGYHPMLKGYALLRAAQSRAKEERDVEASLKAAKALMDQAVALVPTVAADSSVPRRELAEWMKVFGEVSIDVTADRQTYAAAAFAKLDPVCKDRSLALAVMGQFYADYAWDARGNGYADSITEKMAALMFDRLKTAQAAAEKAFEIDADNALACVTMMQIEQLQGEGRPRLELWYERAIAADPQNMSSRMRKLSYLSPKWYGKGVDDLLDFGRGCAKDIGVQPALGLMIVETHERVSKYVSEGSPSEVRAEYFAEHPEAWDEVKAAYAKYLKTVPDSLYHRSRFAQIALWAGDLEVANAQFKAMGDRFSYRYFRNRSKYQQVRAELSRRWSERSGGAAR